MNETGKCQKVQDQLSDYRTGITSTRKSAWIEEHLSHCEKCADELRKLDEVLALVDTHSVEHEPPPGLWNNVYNRITSPEPKRQTLLDGFGRWIAKPVRAASVGVLALAIAAGLVITNRPDEHSAPVQMTSNVEYVQGHALYAGQTPLADHASYVIVVAASDEQMR